MNKKTKRGFKGVWIPKEIWESNDLTLQERVFLVEIDSLDNAKGCYASNSHFSAFFGVTKARCTQVIKNLESKGLIKIKLKRKKGQIVYRKITLDRGVVNFLNRGSKFPKEGSKFPKGILLRNNSNTNSNTISVGETIEPKNKKYLPISKQLKKIVQSKKNINITASKLNGWSNSIRLLVEVDKVKKKRIKKALDWYAEHHQDEYVPVIESGVTLREKFLRLEDAIERGTKPKRNGRKSGYTNGKVIDFKKVAKVN